MKTMEASKLTERSVGWLAYERCVAAFTANKYDDLQLTVLPNVKIVGQFSGVERQMDVLIDSRWNDDTTRRIIVDAKDRKRNIDVKDVEEFEGMMRDCRASRGVLVCTSGFSAGALRRAQDAITITVLHFEEFDDYEWVYEPCSGSCNSERQRGMVLWGEYQGLAADPSHPILIVQTGKCDGCHQFHVWCWDCGSKFNIPDNTAVTCECGYQWIAWPEADLSGADLSMLLGLRIDDEYCLILDRRPTR